MAPDLERFRPRAADPSLRRGKRHLIAYVGMMGPQDGVDHALRALAHCGRSGRTGMRSSSATGTRWRRHAATGRASSGSADAVEFTGLVDRRRRARASSSADVCLAPEPSNPLNDVSTMIKIVEYMAMAKPVVWYDLAETRVTADGAALLREPERRRRGSPAASANCSTTRACVRGSATSAVPRREGARRGSTRSRNLLAAYERALAGANVSARPSSARRLSGPTGTSPSSSDVQPRPSAATVRRERPSQNVGADDARS